MVHSKSVPFQVRKNCLFSTKSDFFQVWKYHISSWNSDSIWFGKIAFSGLTHARKSVPFQVRNNRLFTSKSIFFRFGKNAFKLKSDFFQVRKKSLFLFAKTLEIASALFWRREKASHFRFGKIAFLAEKANSFRFGKIAFSGRQETRNSVRVVLAPW